MVETAIERSVSAPPWKCPHGAYSPTGRAEYCLSCTPEGPPEDDNEAEAFAFRFRTCSACWKTKPIEEFHANPRTGAPYQNCLECPGPRVPNPNHEDRRKEYGLRRRRYGTGDFTLAAWIEKLGLAGWVCTFCERPLTFETAVCTRWIPASLGGANDIENCTPACARCQAIRAASFRWHRLAA